MAYKYIPAGLSLDGKIPKDSYVDLFQETLNQQFYNSTDWWSITEEFPRASNTYRPVDVRINHAIDSETGQNLGDDWKIFLFPDLGHATQIGTLYQFNNNYWITVNTEITKNLAATATVRRCNNRLRWIDKSTGAVYSEPCAIDYTIKRPNNLTGVEVITPGGFIKIKLQFNERTNTIKTNNRFLFGNPGNWKAYKVLGSGINNFDNLQTDNNTSVGAIELQLVIDYVNAETDDVVNGIADTYENTYSISLQETSLTGKIGDTFTLTPIVKLGHETVTRDVTWLSSNTAVATVSNGLVTMISNGSCVITANVENNPASTTCPVTVSALPPENIVVGFTPNTSYIYEGKTKIYSVYLYKDGVAQADAFTVSVNPGGIPATSFTFTQLDDNTFSIKNNKFNLLSPLEITAVSGLHSDSISVWLKGTY